MDHFAGFDQLLRLLLGREKAVGVYGPTGLINAVEHKLRAYTWNLIEGYGGNLTFRAKEIDTVGRLTSAQFSSRTRFEHRARLRRPRRNDGICLTSPPAPLKFDGVRTISSIGRAADS